MTKDMIIYRLCNDNNWFTYGCNSEYSEMFEMVRNDADIFDIALMIEINSAPNVTLKEVFETIKKEYAKYNY